MKKEEKAPAYQWYPKDIISSQRVSLMSLAEEGAYRRALDFCWLHGNLPSDTRMLSKIIGKNCSVAIAKVVSKMFTEVGDKLIHDRLDAEREKQRINREKQSKNGEKGGRPRNCERKEESQTEAKQNPPLLNGFEKEKAKKSSSSSFASSSSTSVLNNSLTNADAEVFDLKYFENNGFSWNIANPVRAALDKYLVYRANVHNSRITDPQVIESILHMFLIKNFTDEQCVYCITNTMSKDAKNIIFEVSELRVLRNIKPTADLKSETNYEQEKSAV